ncbi:MAG: hypothetical protein M1823_008888, partial [Watsoniomyces obsoletus]
MDPNFHESQHNNNGAATSTPATHFASQSQTPNPLPPMPHLADPTSAASYHQQNVGAQGAEGHASGYAQSAAAYGGSSGTQAQDTSPIQNYSAQQHARAPSS